MVAYVYHASLRGDVAIAALELVRLMRRSEIIWVKPHFVIGHAGIKDNSSHVGTSCVKGGNPIGAEDATSRTCGMISRPQDGRDDRTIHGTQKPVECMLRPIENSSRRGDAVYDPFVGSGTTIIAAQIAEQRRHAMDIDPVCCTMAIERWQKFTDREAILEATGRTFHEVKAERSGHTDEERAAALLSPTSVSGDAPADATADIPKRRIAKMQSQSDR